MSSRAIRPSTLDGIKRLAKSIKVEQGIQHTQALSAAAQVAGYENFRHAQNVLKGLPRSPRHLVFLTAYWRDKKTGEKGRETLRLLLDEPWSELIRPVQFRNLRALSRFMAEGPDHLARTEWAESQSHARDQVCHAARTLQFICATRLQPSSGHSRAFPGGSSMNAVPGRDHYSIWFDPSSRRYLLVDEPYEDAVNRRVEEREAWARRHEYAIVKPTWPGMYYPEGGSRLYLIADAQKGVPLEPIKTALDLLPPSPLAEPWGGESAPPLPYFVSPGTEARAKAAQAKEAAPRPKSSVGPRKTIGYVRTLVGPQRRPNAKMPIEAHEKLGALLKSVLAASSRRQGVYNRVNAVRDVLDEWTQREYAPAELPSERFFEVYYHEAGATAARVLSSDERDRHIASLNEAKKILQGNYPDCPPQRVLMRHLDGAIKSMKTWLS